MTASRAILLLLTAATVLMLMHYYPADARPDGGSFRCLGATRRVSVSRRLLPSDGSHMEWFGVGTLMLLASVSWTALEANLTPDPPLDSGTMWWLLGLYLNFTTVWLIHFFRKLRNSPQ